MDPNETLRSLRELVEQVYNEEGDVNDQLEDFAGYFEDLDGWISKGGFLPRDWNENRAGASLRVVVRGSQTGGRP